MKNRILFTTMALLLATFLVANCGAAERPNVLFLISDDLRTEMGCYGSPVAKTPNLDALAGRSLRFDIAYCQFPLCNPSRSSMLTGLRPTTVGVLGNRTWFGRTCPEAVSLPRHFKQHGYRTLQAGKIFHGGIDDAEAWTAGGRERYFGAGATAKPPARRERDATGRLLSKSERSDRWIVLPGEGEESGDYRIASEAIECLREAASDQDEEPFFLACGFHKPHSPLEAPQRFYDLFDAEDIILPEDYQRSPRVPSGFPAGSIRPRNADLFVGRESTPQTAREMIRAYHASTAWMDFNAGRVLDVLKQLELDESTIVLFWGDHGYQLGEKGKWSKAGSLWEQGARVPLLIRVPGAAGNGDVCPRPVETIDLYPTLCELCQIPLPEQFEGRSLAPFLEDPNAPSERPAYCIWSEDGEHVTGVAVRTERWRYCEFFGRGAGQLLTDSQRDPAETVNLASDPEYAEQVAQLSKLARKYAAGHLPPQVGESR